MGYGVCVECKVRDNDSSEKELHQCPYCGRHFCVEHSGPKLVYIPNFNSILKDAESKVLETTFRYEYSIEGKHPCFQYTMTVFDGMRLQEQIRQRLRKEAIDRMMAREPWWKKFQDNRWKKALRDKKLRQPPKQPIGVRIPLKGTRRTETILKTVGKIILGMFAILGGFILVYSSVIQKTLEPWLIVIPLPIPIPIPVPIPLIGFLLFFAGIGIIGETIRGS